MVIDHRAVDTPLRANSMAHHFIYMLRHIYSVIALPPRSLIELIANVFVVVVSLQASNNAWLRSDF